MKCEGECGGVLVFGFQSVAGKDGSPELAMAEKVVREKPGRNGKLWRICFISF